MYLKEKSVEKLLNRTKSALINVSILDSYNSEDESLSDTICLLAAAIIRLSNLNIKEETKVEDCLLLALSKEQTHLSICNITELLGTMTGFDQKLGQGFKKAIDFQEDMIGDHFLISCVELDKKVSDSPIRFFRYTSLTFSNKQTLKTVVLTVKKIESIIKEAL